MADEATLTISLLTTVRGDLATAISHAYYQSHAPEYVCDRFLQSIRLITAKAGDAESFKETWEGWAKNDESLPTFEQMMDPKFQMYTLE